MTSKIPGYVWEPWSSGYDRRLVFKRSWVCIPAPNTGCTFFTLICYQNCSICLKRPKINKKWPGMAHIIKTGQGLICFSQFRSTFANSYPNEICHLYCICTKTSQIKTTFCPFKKCINYVGLSFDWILVQWLSEFAFWHTSTTWALPSVFVKNWIVLTCFLFA